MRADVFGDDPLSNEGTGTGAGSRVLKIKFQFFSLIRLTGFLIFYK